MVTLQIIVEVPGELHARAVMAGLRAWCENNPGCRVLAADNEQRHLEHREIHPRCPECGDLMTFDSDLQEWVCHHEEA